MPVKKLKISFEIEMGVLMAALANGHSAMNIDAFQNAVEETRVTHTDSPLQITDRTGLKGLILSALKDKKLSIGEIRLVIVDAGYSAKSLNSGLHQLMVDKLVKRIGYSLYSITKKGLTHAGT
jgi:hypothetical protein